MIPHSEKVPQDPFAIKDTDTLAEPPDTKRAKNSPLHLSGILKQVYGYFVWEITSDIWKSTPRILKTYHSVIWKPVVNILKAYL